MEVTAPGTRGEIIVRLREILASPVGTIGHEDSCSTCEFFFEDLAFGYPYDPMVGIVLIPDELGAFRHFMTILQCACGEDEHVSGARVVELKAAASSLLDLLLSNDSGLEISDQG